MTPVSERLVTTIRYLQQPPASTHHHYCEIGFKYRFQISCYTEYLIVIALVASRLPGLPTVCMEHANLPTNTHKPLTRGIFFKQAGCGVLLLYRN